MDLYRENVSLAKTTTQKKYRVLAYPPFRGCFDGKAIPKVLGEYNWYVLALWIAWRFTQRNVLAMTEIQRRKS